MVCGLEHVPGRTSSASNEEGDCYLQKGFTWGECSRVCECWTPFYTKNDVPAPLPIDDNTLSIHDTFHLHSMRLSCVKWLMILKEIMSSVEPLEPQPLATLRETEALIHNDN